MFQCTMPLSHINLKELLMALEWGSFVVDFDFA